jgi:hypothetical protein
MDSTTQTTDGDIKLNSDLFDLAEKLRIELQKKDQELEDKNEEITVLTLIFANVHANKFFCLNVSCVLSLGIVGQLGCGNDSSKSSQ